LQNAPQTEKFIYFFLILDSKDINVCKGLLGDSYGVCVLNVWDEYKKLDYQKIYDNMKKPSFVFNGRNVVDCNWFIQLLSHLIHGIKTCLLCLKTLLHFLKQKIVA